jgi:hypothetical protein
VVRACDGYLGSSLHWLVVVIPLTDYTPAHGPLMVSPGKHKATRVLPTTNGRTHPISVAAIPAQSDTPGTRPPMVGGVVGVDLLDPELRRGDMFLFNGFTWHFAAPNQGPATRLGLYMKFRARSAPSSCGPLLFPSAIAAVVPSRLLPYHRRDGTQTIDRAVWILEDGVSHEICMLANGELPGVDLPSTGVMRQNDTGAWDLANVIGACLDHAGLLAGCDLGWLSWVTVIRLLAHIHLSPVRRISLDLTLRTFARRITSSTRERRTSRWCVCTGTSLRARSQGRRRSWPGVACGSHQRVPAPLVAQSVSGSAAGRSRAMSLAE